MGWLDNFSDRIIGLDTAPIIYFIEKDTNYYEIVHPFFDALSKGQFTVVTSTITLLEVLVHPYRRADYQLAEKYREILLHSEHIKIISVSPEIADESARLRAKYGIYTPDAIQLAVAIKNDANIFLTNDKSLKQIEEIDVLLLDDIL